MEVQVVTKNIYNSNLLLVFLFEQNNAYSNPNLYKIGFGTGKLSSLKSSRKDKQSKFIVKNIFTLDDYVEDDPGWLLYSGSSTLSCKDSLILISKNVVWIGEEQVKEFDLSKRS